MLLVSLVVERSPVADVLCVNLTMIGDHYGALGFATAGMDGPIVACYVPSVGAGVCVDKMGASLALNSRSPSSSVVVAYSRTGANSWLVLRTPVSYIGASSGSHRAIFAEAAFYYGPREPAAHTPSGRAAAMVNVYSGVFVAETRTREGFAIAYLVIGGVSSLWLSVGFAITLTRRILTHGQVAAVQTALCLTFVGFVALIIGMTNSDFQKNGAGAPLFRGFGEAAKMIFVFLLLPITRHCAIGTYCFGSSFERVIPFHILMGVTLFLIVTVHFAGMYDYFAATDFGRRKVLAWDGTDVNLPGLLAWVCMAVMVLTALFLRRKFYTIFKYSHYVLFCLVVSFAIIHQNMLGFMLIPGLLLWVVDIAWRYLRSVKAKPAITSMNVLPSSGILCVNVRVSWGSSPMPGQYVFLGCSALSFIEHPLSIVEYNAPDALLCVKLNGGSTWTQRLAEKSSSIAALGGVTVQGPFGTLQVPLERCDGVVLVAGGVGITPMLSIFKAAAAQMCVRFLDLIWVCRDSDLVDLLLPRFEAVTSSSATISIQVYATKGTSPALPILTSDVMDEQMEELLAPPKLGTVHSKIHSSGRPDFMSLLGAARKKVLPSDGVMAAYLCGPDAMMSAANKAAISCGFVTHLETFCF